MSETFIFPSITLVCITTPLYGSYTLSNINPLKGLFISPFGDGTFSIIFGLSFSTIITLIMGILSYISGVFSFALALLLVFIGYFMTNIISN